MKSTDHPHLSGLSLERPEAETAALSPQEQALLSAALEGLRARQAEPHLGNLLNLIEQPGAGPAAKGNACLILTDYYRDVFGILQNRPDPDRAAYYAQRAMDCGLRAEGACVLADIRLATGDVEGAVPHLLEAVRADYGPVFPLILHPAIQDQLLPNLQEVFRELSKPREFTYCQTIENTIESIAQWYWGLLYLAMRRWAVHPDNPDAFNRQEALDNATLLIRTVADVTKMCYESAGQFRDVYRAKVGQLHLVTLYQAQFTLATEANPTGEDLDICKRLSINYFSSSGNFQAAAHARVTGDLSRRKRGKRIALISTLILQALSALVYHLLMPHGVGSMFAEELTRAFLSAAAIALCGIIAVIGKRGYVARREKDDYDMHPVLGPALGSIFSMIIGYVIIFIVLTILAAIIDNIVNGDLSSIAFVILRLLYRLAPIYPSYLAGIGCYDIHGIDERK